VGQAGMFYNYPYLDAGSVNLGNAFTFSAWVNVTNTAYSIQTIWANGPGGYGANQILVYVNSWNTSDGKLWLETGDGGYGDQLATPPGSVSFNQWHFVTAAVNRAGGTAQLYVDGTLQASDSTVIQDCPTNTDMNLGRFNAGAYAFNGQIDEARIRSGLEDANWVWASYMTVAENSSFESYSAVTQIPPDAAITAAVGSGVFVSWPGSGVGFSLYTATNLVAPVEWSPVTNVPTWTNNQWEIMLPVTNSGSQFYRLQSQ